MIAAPGMKRWRVMPRGGGWVRRILFRLESERRFKAGMTVGLTLFFCIPYFALQSLGFLEARTFEPTWIDRAVRFEPGWIWVYQSAYLLLSIGPWLTASRGALRAYAAGFVLLSSAGFAVFALFPVACPRPADPGSSWMYTLVTGYDGKENAFPSLHCALAAHAALFLDKSLVGSLGGWKRAALGFAALSWVAAIGYSTLATKQHYFIDVPAGMALGWLSHAVVWKGYAGDSRRLEATFFEGATDASK